MIEVKNVSFQYSDSRYGVQNINLTVADGECIAITGESGCGKTTLTRLINGLAPAYYHGNKSGSILITGRNISNLPLYKIGRIVGSIFQDPQRQFFSSQLDGEVAFACENYGFSQDEIVNRTDISIKKMDLNHLRNTSLNVLSGGEKQRVAIARALVNQPDMIVADEPTGSLDSQSQEMVLEVFKNLAQAGKTVLIVTHNPEVTEYADVIIKMKDGEVVEEVKK